MAGDESLLWRLGARIGVGSRRTTWTERLNDQEKGRKNPAVAMRQQGFAPTRSQPNQTGIRSTSPCRIRLGYSAQTNLVASAGFFCQTSTLR